MYDALKHIILINRHFCDACKCNSMHSRHPLGNFQRGKPQAFPGFHISPQIRRSRLARSTCLKYVLRGMAALMCVLYNK